ncbi:MAG: porin [Acidobacteria bacterium]|nr:porin [Acidobacteriota bacterium]
MSLVKVISCSCICVAGLFAQAEAPASATPAAPAAQGSNWTYKGLRLSGMADAYYSLNFNHPAVDHNDVRTFDTFANQLDLNMAKFGLEYQPGPVGFRLDAGTGEGFNIFHSFDPNKDVKFFHHILQAYVSLKPKSWGGLQIDAGKFYTNAGSEVTEPQLNYNYSRSLLFQLGPFYHVGVRASMPVGKHFTGGVQLVNGWNNLVDNNSGKTLGLNGTFTAGPVTWANTYYSGPEHTHTNGDVLHTNGGWRYFYDSALSVTMNPKTTAYVNFDYGIDRNFSQGATAKFYGIAGAMRYQLNSRLAFSPRAEFYNDCNGWATGTAQKLKEVTMTAEVKLHEGILARAEYRQDWSDQAFFHRGNNELTKTQPTVMIALIAFFGPKN